MPRMKPQWMSKEERGQLLKTFFITVASLENYREVQEFFKDLLSGEEIIMLSRRLKIAEMLLGGQTYEDIYSKMKVGFDTISRVNLWLQNGIGYKNAIKRLKKAEKKIHRKEFAREKSLIPFTWAWYKKKYPTISFEDFREVFEDFDEMLKKVKKRRSILKQKK